MPHPEEIADDMTYEKECDVAPHFAPDAAQFEVWIVAARAGSEAAFLRLVDAHRPLIWSIVWRATRNTDDALDVTQEIIIRLWRTIGRFRGESSFGTWVRSIAVRESLRWLAARGRRPIVLSLDSIEAIETVSLKEANPDAAQSATAPLLLEAQDQRKLIEVAMRELSERQRMAVGLRFYDELAVRDIGAAMGCSEGAVKRHLFRAMKHMRRLLRRKE